MNVDYRTLTAKDIEQVAKLMCLLQHDQAKYDEAVGSNSPNQFILEATLLGVLENIHQAIFVAVQEDIVVGYIFGWISAERSSYFPLENYLYISDAVMHQNYRKNGHYSKLLQLLEQWALDNGCKHSIFEAYPDNTGILSIMEGNAYKPYKVRYCKHLL